MIIKHSFEFDFDGKQFNIIIDVIQGVKGQWYARPSLFVNGTLIDYKNASLCAYLNHKAKTDLYSPLSVSIKVPCYIADHHNTAVNINSPELLEIPFNRWFRADLVAAAGLELPSAVQDYLNNIV